MVGLVVALFDEGCIDYHDLTILFCDGNKK